MTSFKMALQLMTEQKTRIVEWFLQTNSIVTVQRRFKNQYKCKKAPTRNTVKTLVEQFRANGNMAGKKRGGSKPRPTLLGLFMRVWPHLQHGICATVSLRKGGIAFDSMAHTSNRSTHTSVQDLCLPVSDNCVPRKADKVCGGIR